MLRQRRAAVRVERPLLADLAHQLAGAAHLAGRSVLEHQHELLVAERVALVAPGRLGALELAGEGLAVGGQVGEAAAGQLGHLVERLEVVGPRGPEAKAHRRPSVARRWRTSADKAARSLSEEAIKYSSGEWIAPP